MLKKIYFLQFKKHSSCIMWNNIIINVRNFIFIYLFIAKQCIKTNVFINLHLKYSHIYRISGAYMYTSGRQKDEIDRKRCFDSRTVLDRREVSPQELDYRAATGGFENCGAPRAPGEDGGRVERDWFYIRHRLDRFEKLDWLSAWFGLFVALFLRCSCLFLPFLSFSIIFFLLHHDTFGPCVRVCYTRACM